ncbi:hypothetical protein PV327_000268 [Microctonus hyperodae]|uniref:CHHC U11-48K-type domain-containing protein n=1 Tax=Microctonus hyperodae TaxID=165561 RepID=A0AA39G5V0_MICHY|nr:hypothetical protein PV327_000268 [Microctonus hyperodae]
MSKAEDPLVDCPLDNVHRIRSSRLQYHLVRCLKNHTLSTSTKVKCPFNPLHIVEAVEVMHHCKSCPDSASVLLEEYDLEGEKCYSGLIGFDEMQRQFDANFTEQYEKEKCTMNNRGYDPNEDIENKPVYRIMMCESKSKRQEFRMRERQRFAALDQNKKVQPSVSEVSEVQKPLRQPFQVPQKSEKNDFVSEFAELKIANDKKVHQNGNQASTSNGDKTLVLNGKPSTSSSSMINQENKDEKDFSSELIEKSEKVDTASKANDVDKLNVPNRKEYSIKEKKNKLMNTIAPSNEKSGGNIISYRDAAKIQPTASCSDTSNKNDIKLRNKQKCAANFNMTEKKSETASYSGLRLPHSVDSSSTRKH